MAKINTGTITADANGNWTSDAIDMGAYGSKTVYMRVNGMQVLTRNFTTAPTPFAFVKAASNDDAASAPSSPLVVSISTSAGSLLVAVVRNGTSTLDNGIDTTHTMSDTSGTGTWVKADDGTGNLNYHSSVWYKLVSAAVTSVTCTFGNNGDPPGPTTSMVVMEFTGASTMVLEQNVSTDYQAANTSITSSSLAATDANALVIFALGFGGLEGVATAGANFTIPANGYATRVAMQYRIVTASFSDTTTMSWVNSVTAEGTMLSFKPE
jgi:hypothetical protein